MENPTRIATLENEIEATLLSSLLEEEGIQHLLRTYHDSAYDGLFQAERGWGHIEADERDRDRILEVLSSMRESRTK